MGEYQYSICGIPLVLSLPDGIRPIGSMEHFHTQILPGDSPVYYMACWYREPSRQEGNLVEQQPGCRIFRKGKRFWYAFHVGGSAESDCCFLEQQPEGDTNFLWLPESQRERFRKEGFPAAQDLGQELLFLAHDRLLMHASLVRVRGQGILFTGPSGMGKSTQAGLWQRHRGAEILNGDKAVLQLSRNLRAWGSPYAGTSGIYRNEMALPVGIISLRQGRHNEIQRLRGREALLELLPRMTTASWAGPDWHGRGIDLALELVERVPVYRLCCLPDLGAVELAEKALFSEKAGEERI